VIVTFLHFVMIVADTAPSAVECRWFSKLDIGDMKGRCEPVFPGHRAQGKAATVLGLPWLLSEHTLNSF
jgi:hypothetical protein